MGDARSITALNNPQVRVSNAKGAKALIVLALAALLALAWWGWSLRGVREVTGDSASDQNDAGNSEAKTSASPAANPRPEPDLLDAHERASPEREPQSSPTPAPVRPKKQQTGSREVTLVANFVGPARQTLTLGSGTLVLRPGSGVLREVAIAGVSSVQVEGLARDQYVVNVIAPGFDHREQ